MPVIGPLWKPFVIFGLFSRSSKLNICHEFLFSDVLNSSRKNYDTSSSDKSDAGGGRSHIYGVLIRDGSWFLELIY